MVDNSITADVSDKIIPPVAVKAGSVFDKIKTPVFWFAIGYAVSMYIGRKKKQNAV